MTSSLDKPRSDTSQELEEDYSDDQLLNYEINPEEKARLLKKLDSFIAPVLIILYLIAFLDRSNIGNAAVGGMIADLHFPSNGLSVATSIFYATYVLCEIPATTLLKSLRPSRLIPSVVIIWGVCVMSSAWMKNYAGLIVTRLVLGLLEAALTPCLFLWITSFYQRDEIAKRQCFLFISAALSGVVGGLIAAGLLKLDGLAGMKGWQWLYCIEGAITIIIGLISIPFVPDSYDKAWYLTDRQKFLMRVREVQSRQFMGNESFSWAEVRKAMTDPIVYLSGFVQMGLDTCLYGFSTFLVVIINQFGFNSIQSQLLTAPIYFWAAFVYLVSAILSDKYNVRFWLIFPLSGVSVVGYIILIAVHEHDKVGVMLFACFLAATGIYISVGLSVTWISINIAGYRKRSTAIGLQQMLGNTGGIIAGQIYRSVDKPYYRLGHSVSLGAMVLAMIGMIFEVLVYKSRNAAKDRMTDEERRQQDLDGVNGDRHHNFIQVW